MIVQTYTRRARAIPNPYNGGKLCLQQWHINPDGTMGWHGVPWPINK